MSIRAARAVDATELAALVTELGYPAASGEMRRRLRDLGAAGDHAVFVAELAEPGSVVAWAHVCRVLGLESGPFAEIGGLIVAATARGTGVGRALVSACEEWARQRGLARIRVRSRVERERAHRFYESLGYVRTKDQRVFDKALGNGN